MEFPELQFKEILASVIPPWFVNLSAKLVTHQTNIKERAAMKAIVASRHLHQSQKVALEHTAKTTVVNFRYPERETKSRNPDIQTINKTSLTILNISPPMVKNPPTLSN